MKALVYEGVETLVFRDVPMVAARPGEHLIRIHASGICGSDMHAYLGHDNRRPAPLILGHEAAGVIEDGPQKSRRVTINPLVTCGSCTACASGRENLCASRQIISMPPREGAFAQFVAMPDRNLVTVPDNVPLEKAALAEPLAVSWHAARLALEALHPDTERHALVIGGGAIGLAAALALRAMGVKDVTIQEPNAARRAFLTDRCGQQAVAEFQGMVPLVVDAVGYAATRAAASACAAPGGVIAHVGLGEDVGGLDIRRMTLQEITFIGTYTYTAQDFRDTAQAIFDGRLGTLDWSELRPLSEGAAAFHDLRSGIVAAPKIILSPWA
ncbi:galactitol-1-phosphate 5-dehydrogenase [Phaeobacter inhibens]|uniref:alcohol dehydrogenase catalytic domain-containing protein n=1 Tax=Phaeobacter inhibens TaxID=221822 RepID=UPI000160FB68|nr:alcohol dehydrogenase catalytic domain-containing protein [Phaeobacter inhibens]AFO86767.1 putative zinc-binding alcohol dehydrogenase [Phaeobacter inhibens 2.10]AXT41579.1 galactitol-1-phosphate 5-dehydrogenase [Phaeobacter inhibens]